MQWRPTDKSRPLVAVLCSVPLLGEALNSTLDFAEVRTFAAEGGDVAGLLSWLQPDAIVVDTENGAREASGFANEHGRPLLHIEVRELVLRLYRHGSWEHIETPEGPTPEAIRNAIAGALFARNEVGA